jgi:Fur family ferric uptake transcriptional regulator
MYEIAGNDHHHLVCRICGDEIEVEHVLLEHLYQNLESTSGYMRIDSHMTFFGVCPSCQ